MPGRGLTLLSLDGGGIRGLSSLQVLKNVLERLAREKGLQVPPKPCEVFDMMGGTSTGGLIAIMLGRLQMSIDECIEAYIELSDKVFHQTHTLPLKLTGKVQGKFDSKALENAVKQYLVKKSLPEECLLQNMGQGACKVFVCATSGSTCKTVLLTSYSTRRTNSDRLKYTKVWQAARATSAASGFFDPIVVQLGSYKETYVDGATGANNPINHLWHEAKEAFLKPGENLEDHVDCVISIGTGIPAIAPFGSSLKAIGKSLVAISTETEDTAKVFRRTHEHLAKSEQYFRLNVAHGLEVIGLERVDRKDDIINITNLYLESDETLELMDRCVKTLTQHECEFRDSHLEAHRSITLQNHRTWTPAGQAALIHAHDRRLVQTNRHVLFDNISVYDHETRLLSISTRLVPGTARWILENKDFLEWRYARTRSFFLCTGIVGSGKTMIASLVIEHLLRHADPCRHVVAHYFLDPKYPQEVSATALLRGVIRQVVHQLQRAGRLPGELLEILQEFFGSRAVFRNCPALHNILQKLLIACDECTIVVDGLHEMPEKDISVVLQIFRNLQSQPSLAEKVKFAIFCREQVGRSVSLATAMPNTVILNLTLGLLQDDIAFFIDESIRQKTMCERQLTDNEALLDDVRSILREHGEKMFLWIDLQLCTIWQTCFTDGDIRLALNELPLGLEETYSRCLSRVSQDEIARKYGYRILYLTAHVQRPLRPDELREAISAQEMPGQWDESKTIRGPLLQYCANLVEQDHLTAVIRLIHPSVNAFLEHHFRPARYPVTAIFSGKAYSEADTFGSIGAEYCRDVCLKYLTMRDFGSQLVSRKTVQTKVPTAKVLDEVLRGSHVLRWAGHGLEKMRRPHTRARVTLDRACYRPLHAYDDIKTAPRFHFLVYLQEHWPFHARYLQPTDQAWPIFVETAAAMNSAYRLHPWVTLGMSAVECQRALFRYAVETSTIPLLQALTGSNKPTKLARLTEMTMNDEEGRAVHVAASKGRDDTMRWLLQIGGLKQLALQDAQGDVALHTSARSGNVEALEVIVANSPAENLLVTENSQGDVPLVVAAINGQSRYLEHALLAVQELISSKKKTTPLLQNALSRVLSYHANATDRLLTTEPAISPLVSALLDVHEDVSWDPLIGLALDNDIVVFFELLLSHPQASFALRGRLENQPPEAPRGSSILHRACRFSITTRPGRARIVEVLLEHLSQEILWTIPIKRKIQEIEQTGIITPLSVAVVGVAVSAVAVEVVSTLSRELVKIRQQGRHVPQMVGEIGPPLDGDGDYLWGRIRPDDVERLLTCGALKLPQSVTNECQYNLLHVGILQESGDLLQAIYRYTSQNKTWEHIYSLTAFGDTSETVLTMAMNRDQELHIQTVLIIAADCIRFDDDSFTKKCQTVPIFRDQVCQLVLEIADSLPQVEGHIHSGDWQYQVHLVTLVNYLKETVAWAETNLQSWNLGPGLLDALTLYDVRRLEEQQMVSVTARRLEDGMPMSI